MTEYGKGHWAPASRGNGTHIGDAVYHVPRSQVWEGSRGGQTGHVHLHVTQWISRGRLTRHPGEALCGRNGWYERPGEPGEPRCPRCVDMATRHGVQWPDRTEER